MNLQFQSLLPSLHSQSHLPQRGRQNSLYKSKISTQFLNSTDFINYGKDKGSLAEGAVISELQSNSPVKE